jgi:hypothetical protein
MRSFLVILIQERADGGSELCLAEWHDSVQALGFDGPGKSLGKGVQDFDELVFERTASPPHSRALRALRWAFVEPARSKT